MIQRSRHDRGRLPSLQHEVSGDGWFTRLYHQHVGCRIDIGVISYTSHTPRFKAHPGRALTLDEMRQVVRYMEAHEESPDERKT